MLATKFGHDHNMVKRENYMFWQQTFWLVIAEETQVELITLINLLEHLGFPVSHVHLHAEYQGPKNGTAHLKEMQSSLNQFKVFLCVAGCWRLTKTSDVKNILLYKIGAAADADAV